MSTVNESIILDPTAVATERMPLEITGYIDAPAGVDWGDAAISAYMADQRIGSSPVDYRIPNRIINIPLNLNGLGDLSFSEINQQLQAKVALFQREGGWLMRQIGDNPLYADIVNATLHLGGSWYQAYRDLDVDATLQLECLPDFYGDEVTLDTLTGTGRVKGVLQQGSAQAVVTGDHPGRARIVITDTSGNDQNAILWGFRSRYYDSASTAALVYEAEAMTPLNGAATATLSGASGGSVVKLTALPAAQLWTPMLATDLVSGGGTPLTHQGSYSVWIRAYSAAGSPSFRLLWGPGSLANPIVNDISNNLADTSGFYLENLGTIRLDPQSIGTAQWTGVIQAYSQVGTPDVQIDQVFLVPLDEFAGTLHTKQQQQPAVITTGPNFPTSESDNSGTGTVAWTSLSNVEKSDNISAKITLTAGATSHYLIGNSFGFSLPSAAIVNGIMVEVRRSSAPDKFVVVDQHVRLVKGGVVQTTDRAKTTAGWNETLSWTSYGSSTDLWGGTWLYSDINNSGFGVAISATNTASQSEAAYIDAIRITVYWTLATGFSLVNDVAVAANGTCEVRWDEVIRQDPSTGPYGPMSVVRGDLPRLPPSGLEQRPVELLVKPSRGNLFTIADSGLDTASVQVKYRPCWLTRP